MRSDPVTVCPCEMFDVNLLTCVCLSVCTQAACSRASCVHRTRSASTVRRPTHTNTHQLYNYTTSVITAHTSDVGRMDVSVSVLCDTKTVFTNFFEPELRLFELSVLYGCCIIIVME